MTTDGVSCLKLSTPFVDDLFLLKLYLFNGCVLNKLYLSITLCNCFQRFVTVITDTETSNKTKCCYYKGEVRDVIYFVAFTWSHNWLIN